MTDAQASDLYARLIAAPTAVVLVVGLALTVLHVMALHGRRILAERTARIAGWLVFGLCIGLVTQLMGQVAFAWIVAVAVTGWVLHWAWREGRLGEAGVALIGAGLSWVIGGGLFMALLRADPLLGVVDTGLVYVVLGLLVIGIGIMLIVVAPRAVERKDRELSPLKRSLLLPKAIEREQAMGPVPAPFALAVLAASAGSTVVLFLGPGLEALVRDVVSGVIFIGVGLGVLWIATPRRVVDAHGVMRWLFDTERRMWSERLGRPLPRMVLSLRNLLDRVPDVAEARPLRTEVLAALGRIDEARDELARLPLETAEERATEAELATYIGWCDGRTDEAAIERWAHELPNIEDPATRLRLRVSFAVAKARRAASTGDRTAVDDLLAVRPLIGQVGSRLRDPGAIGGVIVIVVMGLILALSRFAVGVG